MMTDAEKAAWLLERAGKLTASRFRDAVAKLKNGTWAKSRADLIRDLLAERLTGESVWHYVNDAMLWGLDQEDAAKEEYEAQTGNLITACGFYNHPSIADLGATPDGLVNADGLIETKCPTTPVYVDYVMAGEIPADYKPQMLIQIACTGRRWCDFVAYDPRVRKMSPLFIRRYTPTAAEITEAENQAVEFLWEVDAAWEILTTKCSA